MNDFKRTSVGDSLIRWNGSPGVRIDTATDSKRTRAQLRSWHLASGLFWIMNVLIELDIYAFCPPVGHWADLKTGQPLRNSFFETHLLAPFPKIATLLKTDSPVRTDLVVDCCHAFPALDSQPMPTIIWYRNLYGAMFSDYKRWSDNQPFDAWFKAPHYYTLPLARQDAWAIYYALWINLSRGPTITASFDYCKANPVDGIRRILDLLGEIRDEGTILAACDASQPGKIVAQNRESMAQYKLRSGSPSEYAESLTDKDVAVTGGIPQIVMDHLTGHGGADIAQVSNSDLIALAQRFAGRDLPATIRDAVEKDDLIDISTRCRADSDRANSACQLLALAARIALLIGGNSPFETQVTYMSPDATKAFKTALFCLAQAAVPERVREFAAREASLRPTLLERMATSESVHRHEIDNDQL